MSESENEKLEDGKGDQPDGVATDKRKVGIIDATQQEEAHGTSGTKSLHWKTRQKLQNDLASLIASRAETRSRIDDRTAAIDELVENPPSGRTLKKAVSVSSTILKRLDSELRRLDNEISAIIAKLGREQEADNTREVSRYEELVVGAFFDLEQLADEPPAQTDSSSLAETGDDGTGPDCVQSQQLTNHSVFQDGGEHSRQQKEQPMNSTPKQQQVFAGPPQQFQNPIVVNVVQERSQKAPKFSGDYKQYREWSQRFEIHVNSKNIPKINKFESLKECLTGQAKQEIAHIDFCEDQYEIALKRIQDTFGNQEDAEQQHVREISSLFSATDLHRTDKLKYFYSTLSQNVLALIALGKSYEGLSTFLVHNLTKVLPRTMHTQFLDLYENIKQNNDNRSELEFLMQFLERQVRIQTKINVSSTSASQKSPSHKFSHKKNDQGANGFNNNSRETGSLNFSSTVQNTDANNRTQHNTPVCVFCAGSHLSKNCKEVLTPDERKEKLTNAKACYRCLKRNHAAANCKSSVKCPICSHKHYAIMCSRQNTPVEPASAPTICNLTSTLLSPLSEENEESSLLPTGFAWISFAGKRRKVRLLLDPCSHRSYLSKTVISDIGSVPTDKTTLSIGTIGGTVSDIQQFDIHDVELQSCFEPFESFSIRCLSIPKVSNATLPIANDYNEFSPIADRAGAGCQPTIELQIGRAHV